MKNKIKIYSFILIFVITPSAVAEERKLLEYKGVVTFHLFPAKVMKLNKIIENPKHGTSYIREEGILFELDENPNVMANWTVVKIQYYKFPMPKVVKYKVLSEKKQITVNFHAVAVEVDGVLSAFIKQN